MATHNPNNQTSNDALNRHNVHPAKPSKNGPLNINNGNPPCQPYSAQTGVSNILGAKIPKTVIPAMPKTTAEMIANLPECAFSRCADQR